MISVRFSPSADAVTNKLRKRVRRLTDLRIPHRKVEALLDRWVQANFRTQGKHGNSAGWTPFKRGGRYIRGKGIDSSAKLLQDTGRLRASFETFSNTRQVGIRSNLSYAPPHEFGTSNMAARKMLPTERQVRRPIIQVYQLHLDKLARRPL